MIRCPLCAIAPMPVSSTADRLLVDRIRRGDEDAWRDCIRQYEGRLLAFVDSRLRDRQASEDVVQETLVGFLTSLPNYNDATPLESFLFSIAAHKLTDALRRLGRRPTLAGHSGGSSHGWDLESPARRASSLVRSDERQQLEARVLRQTLAALIAQWQLRGEWERLRCCELLLVRGWQNKQAARELGLSEQQVANHKSFLVQKLKDAAAAAGLGEHAFGLQ